MSEYRLEPGNNPAFDPAVATAYARIYQLAESQTATVIFPGLLLNTVRFHAYQYSKS